MNFEKPLPIDEHLPEILTSFKEFPRLLIEAEPGAGKSTRVPLALMKACEGQVILLQPRRLSSKNLAAYLSTLNGTPLGSEIGFQVRGESRQSDQTRLLVMTQGLFLRKLLHDPELPGVSAVLMDEFHERHLEGDLVLAMLQDVQELSREDLKLGVLSATLESEALMKLLDTDDFPCARSYTQGRQFEVALQRVDMDPQELKRFSQLIQIMTSTIIKSLNLYDEGHLLCFLPGVGEISALIQELEGREELQNWKVLPLHGSLNLQEQAQVIEDSPTRKIILSTNVAESSLTVPGVRVVIDSGLEKISRWNPPRDTQALDLELCSKASTIQRMGRAGRTQSGTCIQLWPQRVDTFRRRYLEPAILREDLVQACLYLKAWGESQCEPERFISIPGAGPWKRAQEILQHAQVFTSQGHLNPDLKIDYSINPRFLTLLKGPVSDEIQSMACEAEIQAYRLYLCALLSENIWPKSHQPLSLEHLVKDQYFPKQLAQRIQAWTSERLVVPPWNHELATQLLLEYYQERLSWRGHAQYTQVSGVGLELDPHLPEGLVALSQVGKNLQIKIYHPITRQEIAPWVREEVKIFEQEGKWRAQSCEMFQTLQIQAKPCALPQGVEFQAAAWALLEEHSQRESFWSFFDPSSADWEFLKRLKFYLHLHPHSLELEEVDREEYWRTQFQQWLEPYWSSIQSFKELKEIKLRDLWNQSLDPMLAQGIRQELPSHWKGPSGREFIIEYQKESPKVSCRLQEVLGLQAHPMIAGVPVQLELLSPARRPIQLTQDILGFWDGSYAEVRKEMKGRYPKHPWPENPREPIDLPVYKKR